MTAAAATFRLPLPSTLPPFTTTRWAHRGLFARARNDWAKPNKFTLWYAAQQPPLVVLLTPATIAYLTAPMTPWEKAFAEFQVCLSERPMWGLLYLACLLLHTTWRVVSAVVHAAIRWLAPDLDDDDLEVLGASVVLLTEYVALGAIIYRVGRALCT